MAVIRVPAGIGSLTTTTSGAQVPSSGLLTVTAAEATNLCKREQWGPGTTPIAYTDANGLAQMFVPSVVTSITINGNVYAVTSGRINAVAVADAATLLSRSRGQAAPFQLVTG